MNNLPEQNNCNSINEILSKLDYQNTLDMSDISNVFYILNSSEISNSILNILNNITDLPDDLIISILEYLGHKDIIKYVNLLMYKKHDIYSYIINNINIYDQDYNGFYFKKYKNIKFDSMKIYNEYINKLDLSHCINLTIKCNTYKDYLNDVNNNDNNNDNDNNTDDNNDDDDDNDNNDDEDDDLVNTDVLTDNNDEDDDNDNEDNDDDEDVDKELVKTSVLTDNDDYDNDDEDDEDDDDDNDDNNDDNDDNEDDEDNNDDDNITNGYVNDEYDIIDNNGVIISLPSQDILKNINKLEIIYTKILNINEYDTLEKLILTQISVSNIPNLINLKYLEIYGCNNITEMPNYPLLKCLIINYSRGICKLPNFKNIEEIRYQNPSPLKIYKYESLKKLYLSNITDLLIDDLNIYMNVIDNFNCRYDNIVDMYLNSCDGIDLFQLLSQFSLLQQLVLDYIFEITTIPMLEYLHTLIITDCRSFNLIPSLPKLFRLHIDSMRVLNELPHLQNLEQLTIRECYGITSLLNYEKLNFLILTGCNSLDISHLNNLETLSISHIHNNENDKCPNLNTLHRLQLIQNDILTIPIFNNILSLRIISCKNIKEIPIYNTLIELEICNININTLPLLNNLKELDIKNCINLNKNIIYDGGVLKYKNLIKYSFNKRIII